MIPLIPGVELVGEDTVTGVYHIEGLNPINYSERLY
jgi:hypothetical protein